MDWSGDEFIAAVEEKLVENLAAAGEIVADYMRASVATPYPPSSSWGNPPHKRTGGLQSSITSEVDAGDLTVAVGAPGMVAYWLETGTVKMKPRPFVGRSLWKNKQAVADAVTKGIGTAE